MPSSRIERFFQSDNFAILGMSRTKRNFAWMIYDGFVKAGARVFAVHPVGGKVRNIEFYSSLGSLPVPVDAAVLCFDMAISNNILKEMKDYGIKRIWLQQGACKASVVREAGDMGFETFTGCALMYMPGASFPHRLHRFFKELFAKGKD